MGRYESCTHFYMLYEATENCFPSVSWQNACTVLRETILAPDDYTVEFGNKTYDKTEIMRMLSAELSLSCVYESPQQTHHDILENAANIIKHMNDGYVTKEDYQERLEFLEMIDRYEFALFAAYCLTRITDPDSSTRLGELQLNIIRLREIRDLILNFTRDEVDIEIGRDEYESAKPIYKMLKSLQSLGYEYNFSLKERSSLGIDHEDDSDLADGFNPMNWLKRIMLLELRIEISSPANKEADDAEDTIEDTTKDTVKTIPQNAGISASGQLEDERMSERIAQLRGTYNKRRFDRNRFYMLEKEQAPLPVDGDVDN